LTRPLRTEGDDGLRAFGRGPSCLSILASWRGVLMERRSYLVYRRACRYMRPVRDQLESGAGTLERQSPDSIRVPVCNGCQPVSTLLHSTLRERWTSLVVSRS